MVGATLKPSDKNVRVRHPALSAREDGLDWSERRCAHALASGYGEKSRKKQQESCSYRPAIHAGLRDRTAGRITIDRRGGSVTDCVEI